MASYLIKRRSRSFLKELPNLSSTPSRWESDTILIPKKVLRSSSYFAIEILPAGTLSSSEFNTLPTDNYLVFSVLISSLFPIWVKGISDKEKFGSEELINAFNTYPFPKPTRSEEQSAIAQAERVLKARSTCTYNQLSDLYHGSSIPEHLEIAHEKLDEILLSIYGLPNDATVQDIFDRLYTEYQDQSR